jgi:hypothetical protein
MVVLSVAVPLVARADLGHQERWESEHAAGVCAPAHDHTICTQVGANLSLPSRPGIPSPVIHYVRSPRPVGLHVSNLRIRHEGNPTRAPPSV